MPTRAAVLALIQHDGSHVEPAVQQLDTGGLWASLPCVSDDGCRAISGNAGGRVSTMLVVDKAAADPLWDWTDRFCLWNWTDDLLGTWPRAPKGARPIDATPQHPVTQDFLLFFFPILGKRFFTAALTFFCSAAVPF